MNLEDVWYFSAWNTIYEGIKKGYLNEEQMAPYKIRLMKAICMRDES